MKTAHKMLAVAGCVSVLVAGVAAQTQINGAGATFPNPIYSKWFDEYHKLKPDVAINYQSIGSGAGIRQMTAQTVFFGATDGPMTDQQQLDAPGRILHLPTVLGAVLPIYNLQGVTAEGQTVQLELMVPGSMVRMIVSSQSDGSFGFGPRVMPPPIAVAKPDPNA